MERRRRGSEDAKKDRRDEATLLLLLMEADLIRDSILTRIVPYEDQRGIRSLLCSHDTVCGMRKGSRFLPPSCPVSNEVERLSLQRRVSVHPL